MSTFIGVHECKTDAKGRVQFPVSLKKQLLSVISEGFVLKRSVFNKCLELYPMDEWNKEIEVVNKLNRFVKKNTDFIRMFMAGVKFIEMDGSGRLLITKDLLGYAGLTKDIVMASAVNKIEIWDKDQYEKLVDDKNVDFGQLAEEVMGNIILQDGNGKVS